MKLKKIILDTDIGCDCDDTGALALLHRCCEQKSCELLAVTISTSNPYAAGCADAINRYYDRILPIGQTEKVIPGDDIEFFEQCYGKHICQEYSNSFYGSGCDKPENAVKLLRKTLAENHGEKITVVVIGSLVNMADLLLSQPDEYSPLSGEQLVKEQVDCISLMGGHFPQKGDPEVWFGTEQMLAECNIKADIASAQTFFEKCPINCVISQFYIGWNILTGKVLIDNERKNPVAESYFVHSRGNRCSWDLTSAYYAVFGCDEFFALTQSGNVKVFNDGVTVFERDINGKYKLLTCPSDEKAATRIDQLLLGNF